MSDHLRRQDAALERLKSLHPTLIDLSLGRTERLLGELGNPHHKLPPTIHVAGTNGKGSTIAFLRAMAEAAGLRVHVFTSPHLVRFAERIRLAGTLISDEALAGILERIEEVNAGQAITFFEITTVAALLAFSETPADLLLLEVGLGGRFDATNVIPKPAVSVITPVAIDHVEFLGSTLTQIAGEKAGIIKDGCPVVVARQSDEAMSVIRAEADARSAPILTLGEDVDAYRGSGGLTVQMPDRLLDLPEPGLPGNHQFENAGLAVAAALTLGHPAFTDEAIAKGIRTAVWPGRCQRLTAGPLADIAADSGADIWLDGGHNPHGAEALARFLQDLKSRSGREVVCLVGLLQTKDATGFFTAIAKAKPRVLTVDFEGPRAASARELAILAAKAGVDVDYGGSVEQALRMALAQPGLAGPPHIMIAGSLHLVGEVLAMDPRTWPQ
jgi:dihydrofolate synthase/folylpolyglutamate synthase